MNIYPKFLSNWIFELDEETYSFHKNLYSFEKKKQIEILNTHLPLLKTILEILHESKLLIVNTIEISTTRGWKSLKIDDSDPEKIMNRLVNTERKLNDSLYNYSFHGITQIIENARDISKSGIIELQYFMKLNNFEVRTYSDLWIPESLNSETLQIDLCLHNAPRLEKALKSIKNTTNYREISSDEGVEYSDNTVSQKGFRMYCTNNDLLTRSDFPKEKKDDIKPFLWKYRNESNSPTFEENSITEKKLKTLFQDLLDENEVIGEKFQDGNLLYVFTQTKEQQNNPNDDRYKTAGGKGPIKLNLITKEFERIHYLDFPSEIIEVSNPTLDQISKGINQRKYVNQDDIFDFVTNIYGDDFGEIFFDIHFMTDRILISFKLKEVQDKLLLFLKQNNIEYTHAQDGSIEIIRTLNAH